MCIIVSVWCCLMPAMCPSVCHLLHANCSHEPVLIMLLLLLLFTLQFCVAVGLLACWLAILEWVSLSLSIPMQTKLTARREKGQGEMAKDGPARKVSAKSTSVGTGGCCVDHSFVVHKNLQIDIVLDWLNFQLNSEEPDLQPLDYRRATTRESVSIKLWVDAAWLSLLHFK